MTVCPYCDEELSEVPGLDSLGKFVRLHVSDRWCPGPPAPEPSRWPEDEGESP